MRYGMKIAVAALVGAAAVPGVADAAVTVTIAQSGTSVVASTAGSLNLTGLVNQGASGLDAALLATSAYVGTGGTGSNASSLVTAYSGLIGPTTTFGTSGFLAATSVSGVSFGINGLGNGTPYVFVPVGYISGASLAGSSTFASRTLASLGLRIGTYTYTSGADTVTVNITNAVAAAVPEPASWAMMMLGVGAVGFSLRRRQKVTARIRFA